MSGAVKKAPVKKPRAKKVVPETSIEAIKGFDSDFACNPTGGKRVVYEVGKTFEAAGQIVACQNGLHSVECPFDVFNYYPASSSRYAIVRASGEIARHDGDSKIASARLYVEAEIKLPELIKRGVQWLLAHAKTTMATGYGGHAAATGYSGHAAATGEYGIAASLGPDGTAKAGETGYIVLAHWNTDCCPYKLTRVERFRVGEDGIEAGKTYRLNADGKAVLA